jgi:hypothetical protein
MSIIFGGGMYFITTQYYLSFMCLKTEGYSQPLNTMQIFSNLHHIFT